jgi:hypothetical protein
MSDDVIEATSFCVSPWRGAAVAPPSPGLACGFLRTSPLLCQRTLNAAGLPSATTSQVCLPLQANQDPWPFGTRFAP